jgi:hypothetical protein
VLKSGQTLRVVFVVAVVVSAVLLRALPAQALACHGQLTGPGSVYPYYGIDLTATGAATYSVCSDSPFSNTIGGTSPPFSSGSALGIVGLGFLGGKAEGSNTAPALNNFDVGSGAADANFADVFPLFLPDNSLVTDLQLTFTLHGSNTATGAGVGGAVASLELSNGSFDAGQIIDSGMLTLDVHLFIRQNNVRLSGDLAVNASTEGPGSATADYANTLEVTAARLLDANGDFIQDITLTDALGNTLAVGAPEPSLLTLVACGLVGLVSRRRK